MERTPEQENTGEPEAAAPARKLPLLIMLIGGLVLGGAAGLFGLGPMLAGPKDAAAAEEDAGGHGAEGEAGPSIYTLENLVVNPANSSGQRFLIASIALEVDAPETLAALQARDAQLRDELVSILGRRTVDQLTTLAQRDTIKREIAAMVSPRLPAGALKHVFLPQFVVQ